MNKYPTSTQKEFGTSIVNRDTKATIAVIDAAAVTSVNGQKMDEPRERPSIKG